MMSGPRYHLIAGCSLVTVALLTACDAFGPYACTASVEPAIVVEITDARSGLPLALNATGTVRDGQFIDSLRPYEFQGPDPSTMFSRRAADERAGLYNVELAVAGYQPWIARNVRVPDGGCHVNTQTLSARLQPAGSVHNRAGPRAGRLTIV
jgi:hypothetical protein